MKEYLKTGKEILKVLNIIQMDKRNIKGGINQAKDMGKEKNMIQEKN